MGTPLSIRPLIMALRLALSLCFASTLVARQAMHQQYLGPPRASKSVSKSDRSHR